MSTTEQRLAEIRDQIAQARSLEPERDHLVRELAAQQGYGPTRIARIAGVTRARVYQIIGKRQVADSNP